ncbi:MAG TPA: HipA family kinase [Terriglobales bacterium]|nr:HipA family kinase [Terriglobales bacterium]
MPVCAVEHVRPMKGGAQSQLMRAADGHYYVVKFSNNPQHARVLANELIAGRLARRLGLPVPEPVIVDVPLALIQASPEMVIHLPGQKVRCAPGLQFGSRLPLDSRPLPIYDYLPEPALATVANLADFHGMLLLDKWTCNCNGRQVIFCQPGPEQALRVFMIDQGFCFNAGEWNFPDSPLRGVYSRSLVYRGVTGWESFEPWLSELENLAPEEIWKAGDGMPPSWYGRVEELERLLEALIARRRRVRELVLAVKNSPRAPFENWR